MTKIIFFLWLLSGKVQEQKDGYGFKDYDNGRLLYTVQVSSTIKVTHAYKGEVLNFIRTKSWQIDENLSDNNGRITDPIYATDTLFYLNNQGIEKAYPLYKDGKKQYIIDEYLKCKVYIK